MHSSPRRRRHGPWMPKGTGPGVLLGLLVCIAVPGMKVLAADARFAALPEGMISTSEMEGVAAEICRDHLFDPGVAKIALPAGYRLVRAAEAAQANPALAALIRDDPRLGDYGQGSLCFLSAARFVVDDVSVHAGEPVPAAFWWASAKGPRHADMRGSVAWVQLGSWYSSGTPHRTAILKTDPMAKFVDLDVRQAAPDRWHLRLALPGEQVTAEVRSTGQPTRSKAAGPGYMSVPMSGESAGHFTVFTFFGHQQRSAQGTWRAAGTGVFHDAFAIPGESTVFGTIFQQGWSAKSGLYRFGDRPSP